jgi:hypothetical protein
VRQAADGWSVPRLPKVPDHSNWSNLYGTYTTATSNNLPLIERH